MATLILNVDRDNDYGIKAGIEGPVVYIIRKRGIRISVVSDLGIVSDELLYEMNGSDIMATSPFIL